jgi:hypothetical protein
LFLALCALGSDGGSIGQAVKDLGLEHHPVVTSKGRHDIGAWHIQNVNSYHGRLKGWMRRFHGVATSYLENYLGWFRALDRTPRTPAQHAQPAQLLNLAVGAYWASSVSLSCKARRPPPEAFLSSIP